MENTFLAIAAFFVITLISVKTANGQADTKTVNADSLYTNGSWKEALTEYNSLLKGQPANARFYFRAGYCSQKLKDYSNAVSNYKKAVEIGNNTTVMYNLACAYNLLNQKDSSYYWLEKSAENGFTGYKTINEDKDLADLKNENRFIEIVNKIKINAMPCSASGEYRQFDFWIGEWDVTSQGQHVGTSSIQLILGTCVILENWTDYTGGQGKSFNVFNSTTKKWQQTWVDDKGNITEFIDGEYKDNKMQFLTRNIVNPDGSNFVRRLTFFNLGKDSVRQFSEISGDNGVTWKTEYDFLYARKN